MQNQSEVIQFLQALNSPENAIRDQAEKTLGNMVKAQPWQLAESVFVVINAPGIATELIKYAFIVLKNVFSEVSALSYKKDKTKFMNAVRGVNLGNYGQILINYLMQVSKDPHGAMTMNVIRCISAFAEILLVQGPWPLLIQTINNLIVSPDVESQTTGALMAEELSSLGEKPIMNVAGPLVEIIKAVASKPIHTYKASIIQIIAKVYTSLIVVVSVKTQIYTALRDMTGIYWNFLQAAIEEGDTESSVEIISSVTTLLQCRTKLCTEGLLNGFALMTNIVASGPTVPIELKKNAMTLLNMYINNFTKQLFYPSSNAPNRSPQAKRRRNTFINTDVNANIANIKRIVEVLIMWCSDIPDNEAWISEDPERESDDDDDSEVKPDGSLYLFRIGQDMLDNMANALGYNIMYGILKELTPRLLISSEWTARSTSCIMYCLCVEGLANVPENLKTVKEANFTLKNEDIIQICQSVCSLADDPHPRVRWAVAQTLGQMSVDLSPKLQQLCSKLIIETLLKLMEDAPSQNINMSLVANCRYQNPNAYFTRPCFRVVAHSAASLGNFYTDSSIINEIAGTQNYVVASIDASLDKISRLMTIDNLLIQKNCVTTLGSIANAASTLFASKYNIFIGPCLTQLERYLSGQLKEQPTKRPFAHQLIETISLFGHAVGPERFKEDGIKFMNMLIQYKVIGEGCSTDDSAIRSALFSAMSNVNNSMGRYLQPQHINAIMLSICDTLSSDLSMISVVDPDEEDDYDDDDEAEVYEIGGMRLKYNTVVLEEIEDASDLLELLVGDHFIETSSFYTKILELSKRILDNDKMTMTEFALNNILCIIKAIKKLIKCIQRPEKNESGLQVTVNMNGIAEIQALIFNHIIDDIVKRAVDSNQEIRSAMACLDILRSFFFSAPQYIAGPDANMNSRVINEKLLMPIMVSFENVKKYMDEIFDNEEGDYDDGYIEEEIDSYSSYIEVIGLSIASGFSFMKRNPNFNFIQIYADSFDMLVTNLLQSDPNIDEDKYCDLRIAGCIVGQDIAKLPLQMLNGAPALKNTLANIVMTSLNIIKESLQIKGSGSDVILPPSAYPSFQAGYYFLRCLISIQENASVTNEVFEYVAKQRGYRNASDVMKFIVECCMRFTIIATADNGNIDPEIQSSYDNASNLWFTCILFNPSELGSQLNDCLQSMQKICEDSFEITDIIRRVYHMFKTPTDIERQVLSSFRNQIIALTIVLICKNVVRYTLRPSVVNMAKEILIGVRASDPNTFNEVVRSLNNPIIEADIVEFLSH